MTPARPTGHHHSHGPANRGARVLDTAAPLFVVRPEGPIRGGLVVLHDTPGLTEDIEAYCRSAARDSWLAVAPYHYYECGGRGEQDPAVPGYARTTLSTESLHTDVTGALHYLTGRRGLAPDTLAVLGIGMGADLATWAGEHHDLTACVAYGPGQRPAWPEIRRRVSGHTTAKEKT
jgi:carboxymethylenebutenolidase